MDVDPVCWLAPSWRSERQVRISKTSTRTPIPATPDDLTPAWYGAALDLPVTAADAQVIGAEQGFTGVVLRVTLTYAVEDTDAADDAPPPSPRSVIVKLPLAARPDTAPTTWRATTPAAQQAIRAAREVWCYQQLAAGQSTFPGPRLHVGASTVSPHTTEATAMEDARVVLVLEDLATPAANAGDALAGCTPQQAWQVLAALADWHAATWASPRLDALGWLPRWGLGSGADGNVTTAAAHRQARLTARIQDLLATHPTAFSAPQQMLLQAFLPQIAASVRALADAPRTAIHTDLHLDNVLFATHPAQSTSAHTATIIDWQSVSNGPAAVDVAAFLSASLTADDYVQHADSLRRAYHARLLALGVHDYPAARFERDYRLALLLHLASLLAWHASSDLSTLPPNDREHALLTAILNPGWVLAAATHDLPNPAALPALLTA